MGHILNVGWWIISVDSLDELLTITSIIIFLNPSLQTRRTISWQAKLSIVRESRISDKLVQLQLIICPLWFLAATSFFSLLNKAASKFILIILVGGGDQEACKVIEKKGYYWGWDMASLKVSWKLRAEATVFVGEWWEWRNTRSCLAFHMLLHINTYIYLMPKSRELFWKILFRSSQ